jgi:hypothetical protein
MDSIEILGIIIGIIGIFFAIGIALWATGLVKKGFQKSGPAPGSRLVTKSSLKSMLLKLNINKDTFTVSESKDSDLFIEWKIMNSKWIEALGVSWTKKTYRAWVYLDETTKTVQYTEMIVDSDFTAGDTGVHFQTSFFKGIVLFGTERGYRWGIRDDFTIGEIYNYRFTPSNIKDIVRQIANDHGWSFELVVAGKKKR